MRELGGLGKESIKITRPLDATTGRVAGGRALPPFPPCLSQSLRPAAPRAPARAMLSGQQGDWHVLKAFFPANSEKPKKGRLLWKGCKILHKDFKLGTNSHLPGTVGWKREEGLDQPGSSRSSRKETPLVHKFGLKCLYPPLLGQFLYLVFSFRASFSFHLGLLLVLKGIHIY